MELYCRYSTGGGHMFWDQLFRSLKPNLFHDCFVNIDFERMATELDIYYYIVDVDNTLTAKRSSEVSDNIKTKLRLAVEDGFIRQFVLVSNVGIYSHKRHNRVKKIANELGVGFVCAYWPWIKPHPIPFKRGLQQMPGAHSGNTAVIGDQLFSDIKGGNKLGLTTVLIAPCWQDHWITSWKRLLEKLIFWLTKWRQ